MKWKAIQYAFRRIDNHFTSPFKILETLGTYQRLCNINWRISSSQQNTQRLHLYWYEIWPKEMYSREFPLPNSSSPHLLLQAFLKGYFHNAIILFAAAEGLFEREDTSRAVTSWTSLLQIQDHGRSYHVPYTLCKGNFKVSRCVHLTVLLWVLQDITRELCSLI